jgi:hypothetical protein
MAVDLNKYESIFLKLAGISTAALGIFAAYGFYKNNVWSPKILVNEVDYNKGKAKLTINGKPFVLSGDSSYLIGFDWGIRFGTSFTATGKRIYDRIEILKRNMVHKVIRQRGDEHSFVGSGEGFVENNNKESKSYLW